MNSEGINLFLSAQSKKEKSLFIWRKGIVFATITRNASECMQCLPHKTWPATSDEIFSILRLMATIQEDFLYDSDLSQLKIQLYGCEQDFCCSNRNRWDSWTIHGQRQIIWGMAGCFLPIMSRTASQMPVMAPAAITFL